MLSLKKVLFVGAVLLFTTISFAEQPVIVQEFLGQVDFMQPFENTCLIYQETFPADPFDMDYSIINNVKDDLCPGTHDQCGVAPGLASTAIDSFNAHLITGSLAINAGTLSGAPLNDFDGRVRDAQPDIGAYEWWQPTAWIYLPLIQR